MAGFTRVDNWLFDEVMPAARPNTFKVIAAVVRLTAGWQRESAPLTYDELQAQTGINSRGTLMVALDDALGQGYVARQPAGRSFRYSPKIGLPQSENRTDGGPKIGLTYTRLLKKDKDNEEPAPASQEPVREPYDADGATPDEFQAIEDLVAHFIAVSHCRKPRTESGEYADLWVEPLVRIYQAAGSDFEATKARITAAVKTLRSSPKHYSVVTPASIQNAAVNGAAAQVRGEVGFR